MKRRYFTSTRAFRLSRKPRRGPFIRNMTGRAQERAKKLIPHSRSGVSG